MQFRPVKGFLVCLCVLMVIGAAAQRRANYIEIGRMELQQEHFAKAIEDLNIGLKLQPDNYEGYYLRAYAKFQLEDFAGAEEDCSHSINLYPYRSDVFCYRGVTRDRLEDYEGALNDYKKALELDSTNGEIYLNRALTYHSLQQYELAIADLNQAEKMHVKNGDLLMLRGECEARLKRFTEAISDYNKVISRKPGEAGPYVERGIIYSEAEQKDSAMLDFNRALAIDSENTYALFQKAYLETDQNHFTDAMRDFNRLIHLAPYSATAFFNRAVLKGKMKDYYGALNDYSAVLSINPNHILTYYNRAALEAEKGEDNAALDDFGKVIELYPNFIDAYKNRAQIEKSMNRLKAAARDEKTEDSIQKQIANASDSVKYYESLRVMKLTTLADDLEVQKDDKGHIQNRRTNIQPQPIFSVILFPSAGNKVRVYDAANKIHYAGADLTLFSTNDSMDGSLMKKRFDQLDSALYAAPGKANFYAERGIIFSKLFAYDHALSDFDKAADLDPNNALTFFSRGNTRIKLLQVETSDDPQAVKILSGLSTNMIADNSYELAIADYVSAVGIDSDFSYAWYNMAAARVAINDFKGALYDLDKAISCEPTLAEAHYNKGLLLILMHQTDIACVSLSKAGELGILDAYAVIKRYCDK